MRHQSKSVNTDVKKKHRCRKKTHRCWLFWECSVNDPLLCSCQTTWKRKKPFELFFWKKHKNIVYLFQKWQLKYSWSLILFFIIILIFVKNFYSSILSRSHTCSQQEIWRNLEIHLSWLLPSWFGSSIFSFLSECPHSTSQDCLSSMCVCGKMKIEFKSYFEWNDFTSY